MNIQKIRWKCRRGMLELDLVLLKFMDHGFEQLSENQKQLFDMMLDEIDPDLFAWLVSHQQTPKPAFVELVSLISAAERK